LAAGCSVHVCFFVSSSLDEHKNGQLGGKRGNKLIFLSYSEAHAD
jgi:hypothetical protein